MKKKKLQLSKKVIANLTDLQKSRILGGGMNMYTTSNSECTHFLCCADNCNGETVADTCKATCKDTCSQTCQGATCGGNTCRTCPGQGDTCNGSCIEV